MSEKIIEEVAKALADDTMRRWRSPVFMHSEPWREFVPAARAAIETYKREIEKAVPTVEYFEGCPVDQLDETAYRRYLAYKRDPQNHLRMATASKAP